jgi:regulator of protease activity HflC (stomatin/prohibitin superfamily)
MTERLQDFTDGFREWAVRHWLSLSLLILGLAFALAFLSDRIFIFVYPGRAAVIWRRFGGGTDHNSIYGEGMHIVAPWNKIYIYNMQIQQRTQTSDALAKNGLTVAVQSSFRYRPIYSSLPKLHQKYGPDYLRKTIVPEVASAVQEIIGRYQPEQIYHLDRKKTEAEMTKFTRDNLAEASGLVEVEDVTMMKITLPPRVQSAIQAKIEEEQLTLLYDHRIIKEKKEAERKAVEAQGIADFQRIIAGGISDKLLMWKGIEATLDLAKSPNSKVVVIGAPKSGLPLVLGSMEDSKLK